MSFQSKKEEAIRKIEIGNGKYSLVILNKAIRKS